MGVLARALAEQASEARRLADARPAEAVALAGRVIDQARLNRDFAAWAVAERALGVSALRREDPDAAVRHLRTAVRLGQRSGSAEVAADSRVALAMALNHRGQSREALRQVEIALTDLTGPGRARAQAQRGAILSLLGRIDEALPDYHAALAALRRHGDPVWVEKLLANRAVIYGYRQEFTAAENDLREAEQLCVQYDLHLPLGYVQQNLGWVSGQRGDVPAALHYLELSEQRLREHGIPVAELLTDRAELLLSVRLLAEARQAAGAAVRELEEQRRHLTLPEARLLLAQANLLDNQAGPALVQARAAAREFSQQGRLRWAALARFAVLQAHMAPDSGPGPSIGSVERAADELSAAGWARLALQARLLAGQLALSRGWATRAEAQFTAAAQHRRHGPALQRAQAWFGEAQRRRVTGDQRGATSAARTALRVFDEHWTSLGATDLRAHASGHRADVARFGLRMAFDSGRPAAVLEWAEQGRASHLMRRPVRPPADPALAAALTELRATVSAIFRARGAGDSTAALARRQLTLERWIRDYHRQLPAEAEPGRSRAPRPSLIRSLAETLGPAALLEFIALDGLLHVVTVTDGRISVQPLGPAGQVYELIDRVRFALHRLARRYAAPASKSAARVLLAHAARRLDQLLLAPVAAAIEDRPLVVVPTGALQSLPWSILPSCAGRPVTVTPSAALWLGGGPDAGPGEPAGPSRRAVVAAGPGLPGADREATAVAALHRVTACRGPAATVDAVATALDGAGVVHLAAHGRVHPSNPLFTSLTFADGPLTVYDVERLRQPPTVVVLAACDVGRSAVRAGDELIGLSAAFLALGTRQVVASVVPVPDAETVPLMVAFHRRVAAGTPTIPALATAQAELGAGAPEAMAASAGFISIGRAPATQ
ncbi:MAG TPA: CHAT domain-containing protein [Streptosporangiaceae bacterium]|nr:CHAT domain-containing protein [Streptosporangiaceae bacterium]